MFNVVCMETCKGDKNFIFKKGSLYKCVENKGMVVVIEDDYGNQNIFYKNEYESFFKSMD